jgi:hypothetical protein
MFPIQKKEKSYLQVTTLRQHLCTTAKYWTDHFVIETSEVVFSNFNVRPKGKLFCITHYRSRLFVAWGCLENKLC